MLLFLFRFVGTKENKKENLEAFSCQDGKSPRTRRPMRSGEFSLNFLVWSNGSERLVWSGADCWMVEQGGQSSTALPHRYHTAHTTTDVTTLRLITRQF